MLRILGVLNKHGFKRGFFVMAMFAMTVISFSGCDAIYRLLQKEGAEEKEMIGIVVHNERNQKVTEIQQLLKLYGYKVGHPDGVLGANTRKAIEVFQIDQKLEPTRFVDKKTWEKLNEFGKYGLIFQGELNILAIQTAIDASGINVGGIDGKLGNRTQQAIKEFQVQEGLRPDGKVGYKTLKALSKYLLPVEEGE